MFSLSVVIILGTRKPRSLAVRSRIDDACGVALLSPTLWDKAVPVIPNIRITNNIRILVKYLMISSSIFNSSLSILHLLERLFQDIVVSLQYPL